MVWVKPAWAAMSTKREKGAPPAFPDCFTARDESGIHAVASADGSVRNNLRRVHRPDWRRTIANKLSYCAWAAKLALDPTRGGEVTHEVFGLFISRIQRQRTSRCLLGLRKTRLHTESRSQIDPCLKIIRGGAQ